MKRALTAAIITLLSVIVIFFSCKKTRSNIDKKETEAIFLEEAKNWFNTTFINSSEYKTATSGGEIKQPNWKYGKTFNIGKLQFAEFPLISSTKKVFVPSGLSEAEAKKVIDNTKTKALFIKIPNKPIQIKLIQFTPDFNYLQSKKFDIGSLSFKNYTNDFVGDFMMFDFADELLKGYHFTKNGVKTIRVRPNPVNNSSGIVQQNNSQFSNSSNSFMCDNGIEPEPGCYYTFFGTYTIGCNNGWNPDEGFNGEYCHITIESMNCQLEYCESTNGDFENCLTQGNTYEDCQCTLYGFCSGGGDEENAVTCTVLSDALSNSTFTESTNTQGSGSVISETASEIEWHDFFNLGEHVIPIWATFKFNANNKITIEKNGNVKTFKNYTFGETTKTGTSIWYTCTPSTLGSSSKTISADKKTINGHHWYHYDISLLFDGCPVSESHDRGVSFERKIADY